MTANVKNIFAAPEGNDELFVVIPPNYVEKHVVPIFIRTIDDRRNRVYRGWIEAVRPIAKTLRFLAKRVVQDEWRVSELTEGSVHMLSRLHGEHLGRSPSDQIYVDAQWRARDIAAGGRRSRLSLEVDLYNGTLVSIPEPFDFERDFVGRDLMTRLEQELIASGHMDVLKMMEMYASGSADEIPAAFGIPDGKAGYRAKNTLAVRFRRVMRRALERVSEPRQNPAQAA